MAKEYFNRSVKARDQKKKGERVSNYKAFRMTIFS